MPGRIDNHNDGRKQKALLNQWKKKRKKLKTIYVIR